MYILLCVCESWKVGFLFVCLFVLFFYFFFGGGEKGVVMWEWGGGLWWVLGLGLGSGLF
jgi:hypothetical protein